jgi:hypothetical protein
MNTLAKLAHKLKSIFYANFNLGKNNYLGELQKNGETSVN